MLTMEDSTVVAITIFTKAKTMEDLSFRLTE